MIYKRLLKEYVIPICYLTYLSFLFKNTFLSIKTFTNKRAFVNTSCNKNKKENGKVKKSLTKYDIHS
jgi:hypothetical protein